MSFASYKTAFRTSVDQAPRNEYKIPDVFETTSSNFFNPQVPLRVLQQRFAGPEPAPEPAFMSEAMREGFGNVEQQFPQEFYEADMRARQHEALPQFEEQEPAEPVLTCSDIVDHVKHCEVCRKSLELEFHEESPYDIPEHVVNAIIYIITGIFILFLLDIFVKLGKMLK
jgi:hypothetical protein